MSLELQFNTIQEKLKQLVKQHQMLKKENESLREKLNESETTIAGHNNKIRELQQQVGILQMAAGEMNTKDKRQFEKQINDYLKAIDQCIDHLSQ